MKSVDPLDPVMVRLGIVFAWRLFGSAGIFSPPYATHLVPFPIP